MVMKKTAAIGALILAAFAPSAFAAVMAFNPSQDNTLIETTDGSLSNAAGDLFVGQTAHAGSRRGVMEFDLSSVPSNATITSASLSVNVLRTISGSENVDVHRLTASWGEGTSVGSGQGGISSPGDATWIHRFFDTTRWTSSGGDFAPSVSATTSVGSFGPFSWTSAGLTADVQAWVAHPDTNFGWILIGAEQTLSSVKEISSRESASPPQLTETFTAAVPEPSMVCVMGAMGMASATRRWRR
jgi:hypothetical protein